MKKQAIYTDYYRVVVTFSGYPKGQKMYLLPDQKGFSFGPGYGGKWTKEDAVKALERVKINKVNAELEFSHSERTEKVRS